MALLDERTPGWDERINLERLDLSNPRCCILGQTFGGYNAGLLRLRGRLYGSAFDHGFTLGTVEGGDDWEARGDDWDRLTAAWRAAILARRASRGGAMGNMSELSNLERIVTFEPAYDRRSPNPAENYGIHGVELRMVLHGPHGATQFVLYTGWQLPHVQQEAEQRAFGFAPRPLPADLGYHALSPQYEGHEPTECPLLPGGTCYHGGSVLNAEIIWEILLREGSEGVWRELEDYYRKVFGEEQEDMREL